MGLSQSNRRLLGALSTTFTPGLMGGARRPLTERSFTLTLQNMHKRNLNYPDNTTTLIVKTPVVPTGRFRAARNFTKVRFEPFIPIFDRYEIKNAGMAIQKRMKHRDISFLYYKLAEFRGEYTTAIGDKAFAECTSLTSITLPPHSLTTIGDQAFEQCSSLTSITLPDSVTTIGDQAFMQCSSLTSITLPDSLTTIGASAFAECTSLTSITLPDSLTTIGYRAFSRCTSLTSITLPDSLTTIGRYAFADCTSLTSITLPDSLTTIEDGAFSRCTSLTFITLPDSLTYIAKGAFADCSPYLQVFWCNQYFNHIPQKMHLLQYELCLGCSYRKRKRKRKRDDDDEASFTDTFTRPAVDVAYGNIVPDWAGPGSVVRVQVPEYDRPVDLTVPDGVGPGDMFYWNIVPYWAGPGSVVRMQIIPDGRLIDVTVPDGVGPGEIIQFEV